MATTILSAATATGAGPISLETFTTFQVVGSMSSGTGSATVAIEVSNNGANWLTLGTVTLSLSTTAATDGFASAGDWLNVRANVTSLSANGSVTVVAN